jgi:transposase InsO family protein
MLHPGRSYPDKKRSTTAAALVAALEEAHHVWRIWTDNTGQFMKDFAALVKEREIQHVHTQPRNPKQKGRIEHWWQSLE